MDTIFIIWLALFIIISITVIVNDPEGGFLCIPGGGILFAIALFVWLGVGEGRSKNPANLTSTVVPASEITVLVRPDRNVELWKGDALLHTLSDKELVVWYAEGKPTMNLRTVSYHGIGVDSESKIPDFIIDRKLLEKKEEPK